VSAADPQPPAPDNAAEPSAEAKGGRLKSRLASLRPRRRAPREKVPRRVVVLIPPLIVPSPIMWPLWLRLRLAGWRPRIFRYPSWRQRIPENAARLARWMRALGEEEVDVVAFSLGGIILRWAANHQDLPRLGRVVMLGPPNRGAFMADWLHQRLGPLYPMIWGRCAMQLRPGPKGSADGAGLLPQGVQFGVIAGGVGSPQGFNPYVPGDNDFTVAVQETVLPGMTDFALVRSTHTGLAILGRPGRLVVRFLRTGRFREARAGDSPPPGDA